MHWTVSPEMLICTCIFHKRIFLIDIINNMYAPLPKPLYEVYLIHFIFLPLIRIYVKMHLCECIVSCMMKCIYLLFLSKC